jgi:hypothetical protein
MGSMGHVVHSGMSAMQNTDALFFMLEWDRYGFHKKCVGTRYDELVVLHPVGSLGHILHSGVSGAQNIDELVFMLGWVHYGFHI